MAPRKKKENTKIQEASRIKIIDAAFELFAKKGYASTPVGDIAKKAKISKGLIYHYFDSKQAILKGIFHHLMKQGEHAIFPADNTHPKAYLKKMIEASIAFVVQRTQLNRLLIALSVQPEVVKGMKEELDRKKEEWLNQIIEIFKKIDYQQPEEEAYLLVSILDGIGLDYVALGKDYPIEKVKQLIIKKYQL